MSCICVKENNLVFFVSLQTAGFMSMYRALLTRRVAGGCCRVWGADPRPLVLLRSASVAEPSASRSDVDQLWEAASYLPFNKARIGDFFQKSPVLRNPFLEDALLKGYLRRHLPQEVRRWHRCDFSCCWIFEPVMPARSVSCFTAVIY